LFGQLLISLHLKEIRSERSSLVVICRSAAAESDLFVALSGTESLSVL
jgi:hypothetical protein